ncbi:MAG: ImmA/IrrE family metallo-endopeptidase [Planctomycetaceae bacterium]|nr:ImmA/IrrE family metallo-endopeptidase [Planctomycetaceae bacterium]
MSDRISLGRIAMRSALQLRRMLSIPREAPVNVYDVATAVGVEVQFVDHASLEGMFYRGPNPRILLPSWNHRPKGRIAFSCAHELGHFQLGHGTRVDEYIKDLQGPGSKSDEEFAADTFATSLLMPRQAVVERFARRGWDLAVTNPLELFIVAGELDVGYRTLLMHLRYGLDLVTDDWVMPRLKVTPKKLRQDITGNCEVSRVVVVDDYWPDVPIDLEVGDVIAIPSTFVVEKGELIRETSRRAEYALWSGSFVGKTDLRINDRRHTVRIARTGYCGLLKYRFLDDPDEA